MNWWFCSYINLFRHILAPFSIVFCVSHVSLAQCTRTISVWSTWSPRKAKKKSNTLKNDIFSDNIEIFVYQDIKLYYLQLIKLHFLFKIFSPWYFETKLTFTMNENKAKKILDAYTLQNGFWLICQSLYWRK